MSSKTIDYIRTIEKTHSISAAADELGISQPALSAHLKKVEKRIGADLFDRSHTPLAITDAGHAYLEYAQQVLSLEHEFKQRVSDLNELKTGQLVVGGASSFNIAYLPQALALFTARYPGIEVKVVEGTVPDLSTAALNGLIDLFIAPRATEAECFDLEELIMERALLCVPRNWSVVDELPTASGDKLTPIGREGLASLASHPFIMLHKNQQIGARLRMLLDRYAISPTRTIVVDQTLTALALVQAGVGTALVTEGALRYAGNPEALALYFADEDLCTRMLYLVRPKNRSLSRAAAAFASIMRESVRNHDR